MIQLEDRELFERRREEKKERKKTGEWKGME